MTPQGNTAPRLPNAPAPAKPAPMQQAATPSADSQRAAARRRHALARCLRRGSVARTAGCARSCRLAAQPSAKPAKSPAPVALAAADATTDKADRLAPDAAARDRWRAGARRPPRQHHLSLRRRTTRPRPRSPRQLGQSGAARRRPRALARGDASCRAARAAAAPGGFRCRPSPGGPRPNPPTRSHSAQGRAARGDRSRDRCRRSAGAPSPQRGRRARRGQHVQRRVRDRGIGPPARGQRHQ